MQNLETRSLSGWQLDVNATTGLGYLAADGATCIACPVGGDAWVLELPELAAENSHVVTLTGQLAPDLGDLVAVTTTATLPASNLAPASYRHRVDGQPPSVGINLQPGQVIGIGVQTITGWADDGKGSGVASVQFRPTGSPLWQPVNGTVLWTTEVNVPIGPTFGLEVRAIDAVGNTSDVSQITLNVDTVPPQVLFDLPPLLGGDYAELDGTSVDPAPPGSQVAWVEVQLDEGDSLWLPTTGPYAPRADNWQRWHFTWGLPGKEDGVIHTLRARATDAAGNETTTDWQSTLVDTVAPEVTVTNVISEATLGDYPLMSAPGQPVLEGTASDGDSVSDVFVHVNLPNGDSYQDVGTHDGSEWSYTPELSLCGHHTLRLEVTDRAGNATLEGPFDLFVDAPELAAAFVSAEPSNSISLTARVSNNGGEEAAAGVPVAFYLGNPEAGGTLISTTATTQTLNPGEWEDVSVTWDTDTPGDHEIYIVVDDDGTGTGQIAECEENNNTVQQTVSILDVPLIESWNLMSSYVNPFNTDASVVQRPISGTYVVIQGFDGGAQSYYPDLPPEVNSLKDMDAEHGYWIKANAGTSPTLRVVGEKFAENRPIELDADWNLVGFLPCQPLSVTQALQSIEGQYTAVLGYDQGALSYYPDIDPSFNTLHEMESLFGYWIKMAQAGTLNYPTTGGDGLTTAEESAKVISIRQAECMAGVTPSNTWVNFYGTAHLPACPEPCRRDETPLPVGTTVLALDPDGVVCGATVVTTEGQYGLLACYGDDPTTPEDEGAQPGDTIQLVVDDQVLGMGMWTAHGDRQWRSLGKVDLWQLYLPLIRKGDR